MTDELAPDLRIDPALLARFVGGECTRAEAAALDRWAAAHPARRALLAELQRVWRTGGAAAGVPIDAEAGWAKILGRLTDYGGPDAAGRPTLRLEAGGGTGDDRPGPDRVVALPAGRGAAAALVLAVGGSTWLVSRADVDAGASRATHANEAGGRRSVTLADGTLVTLGPASALRELTDLGGARREVELRGRAFFRVAHDPRRPFRVFARGTEARVLGTEFTVRAYADEPDVEVAVRSGKVSVRGDTADPHAAAPVLTARGMARVGRNGAIRLDRADETSAFGWVAGPVRFESRPLGEVAREMGRWIGLDVVVADTATRATKVTVAFAELSPDSVLARLSRLARARPVWGAGRVTLVPAPEPGAP